MQILCRYYHLGIQKAPTFVRACRKWDFFARSQVLRTSARGSPVLVVQCTYFLLAGVEWFSSFARVLTVDCRYVCLVAAASRSLNWLHNSSCPIIISSLTSRVYLDGRVMDRKLDQLLCSTNGMQQNIPISGRFFTIIMTTRNACISPTLVNILIDLGTIF